ncbi:MAG: GNAT family N-acetyltransferase [Eggerthellaceae bacterium]|jgi:hypothetical protein|nr:GNAT family N-acetyltransferase [Eggerthellaceae bacterium]
MNVDKEAYQRFCEKNLAPIFSQPWWMDAICGEDAWDVWLCRHGDEIVAAMPYYMEDRAGLRYITKAPLTQNNGLIFSHGANSTPLSRQKAEEKIVDEACAFIEGLGVDVYEQQYHHSFSNWSPFHWNGYEAIPRYTYVIDDTSDINAVEAALSSGHRRDIRKGGRNGSLRKGLDPETFYAEHEKIFAKQGLPCPFSKELWLRLHAAIVGHGAGEAVYMETPDGDIASLAFLVWDDRAVYLLLGGSMPDFQRLDTYSMLVWESIKIAHEKGLAYDFEGSMIKRIARSFREYGAEPKLYFRIRKVFNPEVVLAEAKQKIARLGDDAV